MKIANTNNNCNNQNSMHKKQTQPEEKSTEGNIFNAVTYKKTFLIYKDIKKKYKEKKKISFGQK